MVDDTGRERGVRTEGELKRQLLWDLENDVMVDREFALDLILELERLRADKEPDRTL